MQKTRKYVIFQTKWGHFGLAGTKSALFRTQLPGPEPKKIEYRLLKNLPDAQFDKTYFKKLQQQIAAYFEGTCENFSPDIPVALDGVSVFSRNVLIAESCDWRPRFIHRRGHHTTFEIVSVIFQKGQREMPDVGCSFWCHIWKQKERSSMVGNSR